MGRVASRVETVSRRRGKAGGVVQLVESFSSTSKLVLARKKQVQASDSGEPAPALLDASLSPEHRDAASVCALQIQAILPGTGRDPPSPALAVAVDAAHRFLINLGTITARGIPVEGTADRCDTLTEISTRLWNPSDGDPPLCVRRPLASATPATRDRLCRRAACEPARRF